MIGLKGIVGHAILPFLETPGTKVQTVMIISENGHKTDVLALKSCFNAITIGNHKRTDSSDKFSTSTLLRAYFLVLYLNRHPWKEPLLNVSFFGQSIIYTGPVSMHC